MKFRKESYLTFYLEQTKRILCDTPAYLIALLYYISIFCRLVYLTCQVQASLCSLSPHTKVTRSQSALVRRAVICIIRQSTQVHCVVLWCPHEPLKMQLKKAQGKPHKATQIFARHPSISGPSVNMSSSSCGISLSIDIMSSTRLCDFV